MFSDKRKKPVWPSFDKKLLERFKDWNTTEDVPYWQIKSLKTWGLLNVVAEIKDGKIVKRAKLTEGGLKRLKRLKDESNWLFRLISIFS